MRAQLFNQSNWINSNMLLASVSETHYCTYKHRYRSILIPRNKLNADSYFSRHIKYLQHWIGCHSWFLPSAPSLFLFHICLENTIHQKQDLLFANIAFTKILSLLKILSTYDSRWAFFLVIGKEYAGELCHMKYQRKWVLEWGIVNYFAGLSFRGDLGLCAHRWPNFM